MGNVLLHARHHIITGNHTPRKKHEWTEGEKEIRDCRLRTLLKHNPWGEMQEQDGPEEEHKRICEHELEIGQKNKQKKTIQRVSKTYGKN